MIRQHGAALGISLTLVLSLFSFIFAGCVYAEPQGVNDVGQTQAVQDSNRREAFEVTGYDFTATVGKDHSYAVEEKISVNLPDQLSRIEFAIPSGNFRISDIEVENAAYHARNASEASRVVILDPDKLSKGSHEYTVRYLIQEYSDNDDSKDMFYFNVLLPEWEQPIGRVSVRVDFPEDFPFDDMQCYAGQFGVQDATNKIRFKASEAKHRVTIKGEMIPENYGLTLKAQLPEGYWKGELSGKWALTAIIISMSAAALILLVLWLIGGRDPKVRKETVTAPPEGVSPVELGYIFNSRMEIREILYMIIYFAKRGYLRISEYEPKKYRLYKVKEPHKEEKMYRTAYGILFDEVYKGRALEMHRIAPRLNLIIRSISDDVAAGFSSGEASAFTPLSRAFRYVGSVLLGAGLALAAAFSYASRYLAPDYVECVVLGAAAAVASLLLCRAFDTRDSSSEEAGRFAVIGSALLTAIPVVYAIFRVFRNTGDPFIAASVAALSALSVFLIVIMRARGKENAELVSKMRSLRSFIYHPTPKDILENYLKDPDYYYDMLIYALAFGGEEAWAISFLTLDVPEPEWYSDDIEGHAFSNLREKPTTIDYARDLRSFVRTIENTYNETFKNRK